MMYLCILIYTYGYTILHMYGHIFFRIDKNEAVDSVC